MLHLILKLIPAPLHRMLYRVADRARRRVWRIRRPRRRSVFIIAMDERGRVLLVRHSYGPPVWVLPGGGVGRREQPETAAAREFREELQCDLTDLHLLTSEENPTTGSTGRRHVYTARVLGTPTPDMREIVEVGWFEADALPDEVGRWAGATARKAAAAASSEQR